MPSAAGSREGLAGGWSRCATSSSRPASSRRPPAPSAYREPDATRAGVRFAARIRGVGAATGTATNDRRRLDVDAGGRRSPRVGRAHRRARATPSSSSPSTLHRALEGARAPGEAPEGAARRGRVRHGSEAASPRHRGERRGVAALAHAGVAMRDLVSACSGETAGDRRGGGRRRRSPRSHHRGGRRRRPVTEGAADALLGRGHAGVRDGELGRGPDAQRGHPVCYSAGALGWTSQNQPGGVARLRRSSAGGERRPCGKPSGRTTRWFIHQFSLPWRRRRKSNCQKILLVTGQMFNQMRLPFPRLTS